jgi:septum formation protein
VRPLILASTSPYRRILLERLGIDFDVARPGVDEQAKPGESPAARASRLSMVKAEAIAGLHPHAIVIGSDQVAALGDRVLDKPGDAETCRAQLGTLSGNSARFLTGCAVVGQEAGLRLSYLDTTTVTFRALQPDEIARYVDREQPFDCAGGFKMEGLGITLFERVESSDPTALIGLPMIWLADALRRAGFSAP